MRLRQFLLKSIAVISVVLLSTFNILLAEGGSEHILIEVISRPIVKDDKIAPMISIRSRHLVIVSDILPHGIWEVGPDENGMIGTTNTIGELSEWPTNQITQKCLTLGGEYIRSQFVEINQYALLDNIKLYEKSFVGKEKYSLRSYSDNWAVEKVIYGAGGDLEKAKLEKRKQ